MDTEARRIRFLPEGKKESFALALSEDAQIHVRAFFGSLDDFVPGQRVWAWVDRNRDNEWTGVRVLADELSAHRFHGGGGEVQEIGDGSLQVKPGRRDPFELRVGNETRIQRGEQVGGAELMTPGTTVFYQQNWVDDDYVASLILDKEALDSVREESRRRAESRWLEQGFPAHVTWTHRSKGEARILLGAPAMRWTRALWRGDEIGLSTAGEDTIKATVVAVSPVHEKTELHLVVEGFDQEGFGLGQPVRVRMDRPNLPAGDTPADAGRFDDREARLNWLLSSTYCSCGNRGDVCAGHFYTLAACNTRTCAMPNITRKAVGKMIDEGLSDVAILERLGEERGPLLHRQHLLP